MADITRQTFARLMSEIEVLEETVESLGGRPPGDADAARRLAAAEEELLAKRRELARISDGCGRPHHT